MQRTEISTLGEFGLIHHLTKDLKPQQPSTVRGVGDDCAVMDFNNGLPVTGDGLRVRDTQPSMHRDEPGQQLSTVRSRASAPSA